MSCQHDWWYSAGGDLRVGEDHPYRACSKCGEMWLNGKLVKEGIQGQSIPEYESSIGDLLLSIDKALEQRLKLLDSDSAL